MKGQTNRSILQNKLQRELRNRMTDAETRLWQCLRRRQMSGFKFRRQHPFGDYVLDFVCFEAMIVIEIDGSQHMETLERDTIRTATLNAAGFKMLRFWNNEILCDIEEVKESIWQAVDTAGVEKGDPSPSQPSP